MRSLLWVHFLFAFYIENYAFLLQKTCIKGILYVSIFILFCILVLRVSHDKPCNAYSEYNAKEIKIHLNTPMGAFFMSKIRS